MRFTDRSRLQTMVASATVALLSLSACGVNDSTEGSEVEHDPNVDAGPLKVVSQELPTDDIGDRFGGGTLYYPDDDNDSYGVIAAAPGLGADQNMVSWFGHLLASHGFILLTMETVTTEDTPDERGHQLLEALEYVATESEAAERADADNLGVLGHSMGGGGALVAAAEQPNISAVVSLTPHYSENRDWSPLLAPTLIIGGEYDEVTRNAEHAEPLYDDLDQAEAKAYMNLYGDHFVANSPSDIVTEQVVAWFKVFMEGDDSYVEDLCPGPEPDDDIVEYLDTCPH